MKKLAMILAAFLMMSQLSFSVSAASDDIPLLGAIGSSSRNLSDAERLYRLVNDNVSTDGGFYAGSQVYSLGTGAVALAEAKPWAGLLFDNVYNIDKLYVAAGMTYNAGVLVIETSFDGYTWTTVCDMPAITSERAFNEFNLAGLGAKGRMIRLTPKNASSDNQMYLTEIKATGSVAAEADTYAALIPNVTCAETSSNYGVMYEGYGAMNIASPGYAADGEVYGTLWASADAGQGTDDWITFNVGAGANLESAVMYYRTYDKTHNDYVAGAYETSGYDIDILTSDNNSTWSKAKTVTLNAEEDTNSGRLHGRKIKIDLSGISAQYIRFAKSSVAASGSDMWLVSDVMFFGKEGTVPKKIGVQSAIASSSRNLFDEEKIYRLVNDDFTNLPGGYYAGSQAYSLGTGSVELAESASWAGVVFDNVYDIEKLVVGVGQAFDAGFYKIETSFDGYTWTYVTDAPALPNANAENEISLAGLGAKGRMVRLASSTPNAYLTEIQAWGFVAEDAEKYPELFANVTTAGTSSNHPGMMEGYGAMKITHPEYSLDREVYGTVWASDDAGQGTDDWITYYIGTGAKLDSVLMFYRTYDKTHNVDYKGNEYKTSGYDIDILTSNNNQSWTKVKTVTLNGEEDTKTGRLHGRAIKIDLSGVDASFIRFKKSSVAENGSDMWLVGDVLFYGTEGEAAEYVPTEEIPVTQAGMSAYADGVRYFGTEGTENIFMTYDNYFVFHGGASNNPKTQKAWLQVHLGGLYDVRRLDMHMLHGDVTDIYTSVDGVNWTYRGMYNCIGNGVNDFEGGAVTAIDWSSAPVEAAWIRFEEPGPAPFSFVMRFLDVYGDKKESDQKVTNLISRRMTKVEASSEGAPVGMDDGSVSDTFVQDYTGDVVASYKGKTLDSDCYRTYWQSADNGAGTDDWVSFKFNAKYDMGKMIMYYRDSNNFAVDVYTSEDGVNWGEKVKTLEVNADKDNEYYGGYKFVADLSGISTKYIKLQKSSEASGANGDIWRLGEVMFFGEKVISNPFVSINTEYEISLDGGKSYQSMLYPENGKVRVTKKVSSDVTDSGYMVTGLYDKTSGKLINVATTAMDIDEDGENNVTAMDITGISENLAAGKPSRLLNPNNNALTTLDAAGSAVAANATDNDYNSVACAGGVWNWMLETDLEAAKDISEIAVTFSDYHYPTSFDIIVSDTQLTSETIANAKKVASVTDNKKGGTHKFGFEKTSARYIYVRDNVPQENVRQMSIKNLAVRENKTNYEIRTFLFEDSKSITPITKNDVFTEKARAAYERVVIFGTDGAGNFCKDTNTPNIDRIFGENGAFTLYGESEMPSFSAQNWTSMFTGVDIVKHGVTNDNVWPASPCYDNDEYPTIFRMVKENMPDADVAAFVQWDQLLKGIIEDNVGVHKEWYHNDNAVIDAAVQYVEENVPTLLYTYCGMSDYGGHRGTGGYGSTTSLRSIRNDDLLLGEIYKAYERRGLLDGTLFIICTDHGGTPGGYHGGDTPDTKYVMFGVTGETVNKGTIEGYRNKDVASIVLHALGIDKTERMTSHIPDNLFNDDNDYMRQTGDGLSDAK